MASPKYKSSKEEDKLGEHGGPQRTRLNFVNELGARWLSNTKSGARFGRWLSRTIALPQLRRLTDERIPWTRRPGNFTPSLRPNRCAQGHQPGFSDRALA